MALVTYNTNRKAEAIPMAKAINIWKVLTGELEPVNEAQANYVATVKDVHMQVDGAPQSYLTAKHAILSHVEANRTAPDTKDWY